MKGKPDAEVEMTQPISRQIASGRDTLGTYAIVLY
jgi:hypothetical protein